MSNTFKDFVYNILPDGNVSIVRYDGYDKCVEIPSEIEGKKVTKIDACAFIHDLRSVIIPDGVVEIGREAFDGCSNLDYVDMPASIKKVGKNAFRECDDRLVVGIHDIASWCDIDFVNYEANPLNMYGEIKICGEIVDKLEIPQGVKIVKQYAFYGAKIEEIILPDSLEKIDSSAFAFCGDIYSLHIPSKLVDISAGAFDDTIATIERITADEDNTKYYAKDNCLIERDTHKLVLGCKNSVIPNGVTAIGENAFFCCKGLTSIVIPKGVKSIEKFAFLFCKGLVSVTLPSTLNYIGDDAFNTNGEEIDVYIDDIVSWCNVNIDGQYSNPLQCGGRLFCAGKEVTSLTIPDGIKEIGKFAFYSCSSIREVHIPSSVTKIGEYAFSYCKNLQNVFIADGEMSIEEFAFADSGLERITLPNGLKKICNDTFARCRNLTSLTIPNSVECIQNFAFAACEKLTQIVIPASVTQIEEDAFHMLDARIIYAKK